MLTPDQIAIIKATAPVVAQHAERITSVFYPLMFERYPEVREVFNQAHQHGGSQPRALANAVVAYASNIDNLAALGAAVERIVQKHVSLNITPPQYQIVGECLLEAIGRVLGDAVTPEIGAAWTAAYWQLANLLIAAEEKEYRRKAELTGGWRGTRRLRVVRRAFESEVITSFWLAPVDNGPLMDFTPGQYLGLRLDIDGATVQRNYSLSDAPNGKTYRISVKREPGGLVSNYLHDRVQEGFEVDAFAPAGEFTLAQNSKPVVLLTAGVGQTPALPMLDRALAEGRQVIYLHAALNSAVHAFRKRVDSLATEHPNLRHVYIYSEPLPGDEPHYRGFVTPEILQRYAPADADIYFLGPKPFMVHVNRMLRDLRVAAERIRFEFFGPMEALD
ncbi:NO-inducible flavohemoprotein [Steroidobacter agaridevorans]|uniref:NO-inducible flavohemoprotein n=1 Tax=Steroidobacter agaridevorans TaxID=2695856 RepID=UPI001322F42A|nr:NO-inducible flavohemoprotein [Steroidobacter agaridevorans]GFE90074.1 flavohemoprotein [Steroidobacter agaridevorans]